MIEAFLKVHAFYGRARGALGDVEVEFARQMAIVSARVIDEFGKLCVADRTAAAFQVQVVNGQSSRCSGMSVPDIVDLEIPAERWPERWLEL